MNRRAWAFVTLYALLSAVVLGGVAALFITQKDAIRDAAIGYVVAAPGDLSVQPYWLFIVAMGLHFAVNDHVLANHHGKRYQRGRWLLIGGLGIGWVIVDRYIA